MLKLGGVNLDLVAYRLGASLFMTLAFELPEVIVTEFLFNIPLAVLLETTG
jgi:hypothetical protein